MSSKNTTGRIKTSINVDRQLWRDFGAELRRKGLTYSEGLDLLMRSFVEDEQAKNTNARIGLSRMRANPGSA